MVNREGTGNDTGRLSILLHSPQKFVANTSIGNGRVHVQNEKCDKLIHMIETGTDGKLDRTGS